MRVTIDEMDCEDLVSTDLRQDRREWQNVMRTWSLTKDTFLVKFSWRSDHLCLPEVADRQTNRRNGLFAGGNHQRPVIFRSRFEVKQKTRSEYCRRSTCAGRPGTLNDGTNFVSKRERSFVLINTFINFSVEWKPIECHLATCDMKTTCTLNELGVVLTTIRHPYTTVIRSTRRHMLHAYHTPDSDSELTRLDDATDHNSSLFVNFCKFCLQLFAKIITTHGPTTNFEDGC